MTHRLDGPLRPLSVAHGIVRQHPAATGTGERCRRNFRSCLIKESSVIHLLPIVIMAESLVAAIVYATQCKWWPALYWCAAGLLNLAVIMITRSGR